MANDLEPQLPGYESDPQKSGAGKGCLWGCLLIGGLVLVSILCAGFGLYYFANTQIAKYTSETPVELPTVEYTEDELAALETRVETFQEKLKNDEIPEEDLVLTADDINALIAKDENLKGKFFVKIEDNQVKGDVSFPLDKVPFCKGRYFNGSATVDVSMEDGVLIVTAQQAEVNGEPVPEQFIEALREENLAKDVYKDAENAKFMRRFEDIRIEDDRFILRVKRDSKDGDVQENPVIESEEPKQTDDVGGETIGDERVEVESEAEDAATTE